LYQRSCSAFFFWRARIESGRGTFGSTCQVWFSGVLLRTESVSSSVGNQQQHRVQEVNQSFSAIGTTSRPLWESDRLWEGYHERRRCSRDTNPESYITRYTSIRKTSQNPPPTSPEVTNSPAVTSSAKVTCGRCRLSPRPLSLHTCHRGVTVQGVGRRVQGLGSAVWGLGFRV